MLRPRIGATVKNVDVREFREALILRRALEGYAAAMAATNRTDVDVQELRAVLATMSEFASTRPSRNEAEHVKREFMREDLRLHIAIMTAARNDVMKKEIFRLHLLHRMIAAPPPTEHGADATMSESHASEDRRKVVKSLENVVEAIARQDPDAAEAAMVSHIREFVETVLEQMKPAEPKRRQLTEDELVYTA